MEPMLQPTRRHEQDSAQTTTGTGLAEIAKANHNMLLGIRNVLTPYQWT
jgi:hypothetical protein